MASNPLISDRNVDFLLHEVLDLDALLKLDAFVDHDKETCALYLDACRKVAKEQLYPAYPEMDKEAPSLDGDGQVKLHPKAHGLHASLVELGVIAATRPFEVGGAQLPITVAVMAHAYLMAANLGVYALEGLSTGAARLIESFGSDQLKAQFMDKMYAGEWSGTMALTEPQAGSSLSDVKAVAVPATDGSYRVRGTKVFISGGQQDITENIVHLTLARIAGAPDGIKGVSLFAIPKLRAEGDALVPNDVVCSGAFHKVGWRSLPSVQLSFGDEGDCHGWLVGTPHRGINQMFQMMNEARLMVGMNAAATASVAFFESLNYAKDRPQGRSLTNRDPASPQVPLIEHADVRRMLLRQKAIVEGGFALVTKAAHLSDLAEHHPEAATRQQSALLLDLLTPITKSFCSEYGFESNTLAIQIHGGYGYTSEYLPEAWWRDQKLNTIHEGTTGIQSLDLLGRKAMAGGGAALQLLMSQTQDSLAQAETAGLPDSLRQPLAAAIEAVAGLTMELGAKGMAGEVEEMLRHSFDYLDLMSIVVVAWVWLEQATAAQVGLKTNPSSADFYKGKRAAADYWFRTELTRTPALVTRIRSSETSYADFQQEWY